MLKEMLYSVNIVTAIMICIFAIPILVGIIRPLTGERIYRSFASLLNSLTLLAALILSIYLTRVILSDSENSFLTVLYRIFPALESAVLSKQPWVTLTFIVALLFIIDGILYLVSVPIRRYTIEPMAGRISAGVNHMNGFFKRVIGGLWQVPKTLWLVLVFSILLNFYTGFFNSSFVTEDANNSVTYQLVQDKVIRPLLNSSAVKDIRVILNDSFSAAEGDNGDFLDRFRLVTYFNGVTLDEAVKSSAEIDDTAKALVGKETDDKQKAYLIYLWICKNIAYDTSKAAIIARNPADVSSGAIVAFTTRKGVCFDFSCLYVAMCRAAGVRVRFITGMGYTGTEWGDHAWNQPFYPEENRWIDVDTTFGSSGIDYFDRPHFYLDHKDSVVQGEWLEN